MGLQGACGRCHQQCVPLARRAPGCCARRRAWPAEARAAQRWRCHRANRRRYYVYCASRISHECCAEWVNIWTAPYRIILARYIYIFRVRRGGCGAERGLPPKHGVALHRAFVQWRRAGGGTRRLRRRWRAGCRFRIWGRFGGPGRDALISAHFDSPHCRRRCEASAHVGWVHRARPGSTLSRGCSSARYTID